MEEKIDKNFTKCFEKDKINDMEEAKKEGKQKIIHFRYFFYPFLAFLFGIIVSRRLYRGDIEIILISVAIILLLAFILSFRKKFIPLLILASMFLLGNGFYFLGSLTFNTQEYDREVAIVGRVTDDIDKSNYGYIVLLDEVKVNGKSERKIELYIQNCTSRPVPGNFLTFNAKLEKIKPFTLKSFNSSAYRSGARYTSAVNISNVKTKIGYTKVDEKIRVSVRDLLYKHMDEDSASVAYAILFGDKNDVDPNISNTYKNSGIIHILTVSGLHVGFLVALLSFALNRCRVNRYACPILIGLFIIFYAYLCRFSPAVLRAGIMAMVFVFSKACCRNYDSLNSLGFAGFIICLIKPLSALDIGFLMSFFCVFALITLVPILTKFFKKFLPKTIARLISVSLSAQIGILPFLSYFGSQVHLLAFLVNLVVIPLLSVAYPFLFVVCMLGTFMPFLGYLLVPVDYVLRFIYLLARFFEWSHLTIPVSADYFAAIVILFAIIFISSKYLMTEAFKKFVCFCASLLAISLTVCFYQIPSMERSNIAFISSGSSQSLVLTNEAGERLTIGYDYLLSRYQRNYSVGNLNNFISLDGTISGYYVDKMLPLNINNFMSIKSLSKENNIKILSSNTVYSVGGFKVCYVEVKNEIVGVFIKMESHGVFVANKNDLGYTITENIFYYYFLPELIFTCDNSGFDRNDEVYKLVSLHNEGCNYSLKRDGNLKFKWKNNKLQIRGLD